MASFCPLSLSKAAIIYESGSLGQVGVTAEELYGGEVSGSNVNSGVFVGVRFQVDVPTVVDRVGGHFIGMQRGDTFFAAIVALISSQDLPDSFDLGTPDMLAASVFAWPTPVSGEAFGSMNMLLQPGWYGLVFGSGLFSAEGVGVAVGNGADLGNPGYLGRQRIIPGTGWTELHPMFRNFRFVVEGYAIPEPTSSSLAATLSLAGVLARARSRR